MPALFFALALPAIHTAAQEGPVDLPGKEQFHLFLLAGQSNMAGRGRVSDMDRVPHPRVLVFNRQGEWEPAVDPLHFDKPAVVGVGLGRTFALRLAEAKTEVTVGLIPCAVGGSPIESWEPGGFHASTRTHPWDDAICRTRAAMKDGTLKAVLWHQGESDAREGRSEPYEGKLHALVRRFRAELGRRDLPFLAGQLGQFPDVPWNDFQRQVDAVHRGLPARIDHTAFVPSRGLKHKGDRVHFDAASYRELGRRYAAAYLELTGERSPSPPGAKRE